MQIFVWIRLSIISGLNCKRVWTGGWSAIAGSTNVEDWNWYYSNNFSAKSTPFTFLAWQNGQPNNYQGQQHALGLGKSGDYNFNDLDMTDPGLCYLCECP